MDIPESMKAELLAWNNGKGISLEDWIACEGNFRLAVGYSSIFWPNFVEFEDYIFMEGFSEESLREFESEQRTTLESIEEVMNHLHIEDIQHDECKDSTKDKLIVLGNTLKEIYQVKLNLQFPHKPCTVEFYQPEDSEELWEYRISFWQKKHEA